MALMVNRTQLKQNFNVMQHEQIFFLIADGEPGHGVIAEFDITPCGRVVQGRTTHVGWLGPLC